MAIKRTKKKISWYKVARLVLIVMMVVGSFHYIITTPEPQHKSAEEMSVEYRTQLEKEADRKLHEKLAEEAKAKSAAEQEVWLQAQQAEDKARSEKERALFIEHRRDPHSPVTIVQ